MPEIKDLSTLGISTLERPNLQNYDSVDLDTRPNKYDNKYVVGENQGFNRSNNQSGMEQIFQGLASRTLSIVPKVTGGFGSIAAIPTAIADGSLSALWDNTITKTSNDADEKLKEIFPVYQSRNYAAAGLLGKMGTTSFWSSDVMDGLAYAASAYVPGAAIGKGGALAARALQGSKLLKGLGAIDESLVLATKTMGELEGGVPVAKLSSGLQGIDDALLKVTRPVAKTLLGTRDLVINTSKFIKNSIPENGVTLGLATAYNTVAEASAEAYGTKKDLFSIYKEKGLTDEQANEKAGEAASRVFKANAVALLFPNLVQNVMFHGTGKGLQDKLKKQIWASGTEDLSKITAKTSMLKTMGLGFASEGLWEENVQTSIQQYEKMLAKGRLKDEDNYFREVAYGMFDNLSGFGKSFIPGAELTEEEIEGGTAIGLGGIIGMGFGARSAINEKKVFKNVLEFESKRYNDLLTGDIGKSALNLFSENKNSIFKIDKKNPTKEIEVDGKKVSIDNYELDADGNPIVDSDAVRNMTINLAYNKRLWDAHQVAAYKNDPALLELNRLMAMGSMINNLMSKGYTTSEMDTYFDHMLKNQKEAESESGMELDFKQNLATLKGLSRKFADLESNLSVEEQKNNPNYYNFKRANLFYLTAKKEALLKLPQDENVAKQVEDINEYMEDLTTNSKKLEKTFNELYMDPARMSEELEALKSVTSKTPEQLSKMKELTYELNQYAYREGAATSLPMLESRIGVKPLGKKQAIETAVGRTELAVEGIKEGMDTKSPFELIGIYNSMEYTNDETEALRSEIETKLLDEQAKIQEANTIFNEMEQQYVGIQDAINDGFDGTMQDYLDEIGMEVDHPFSVALMERANLTPDSVLNFANSATINTNIDSAIMDIKKEIEYRSKLDEYADRFLNKEDEHIIGEQFSDVEGYKNAENKDAYINELFYRDYYKTPITSGIKIMEEDDEFDDDVFFYQTLQRLSFALEYHTSNDTKHKAELEAMNSKLINEIQPKMVANLSKRAEKHRDINNTVVTNLASVISGMKLPVDKIDPAIEVIMADDTLSFDGVFVLLEHLKKDHKDVILEKLKQVDFTSFFTQFGLTAGTMKQVEKYMASNPEFVIQNLINKFYKGENPSYITKFLNDFDFDSLSKIKNDDFAQAIVATYNKAIAVNLVENFITAKDFNYNEFMDLKSKLPNTPSLQQNIALTQGLLFLLSPTKSMLLSKGIGGSGKTFMLGPSLMEIYSKLVKKANVYAFSKSDLASQNINKALFNDASKGTMNKFLELDDVEQFDYILIDEVFTLTNEEIEAITSKTKGKVKIIMLGDPSQYRAESEHNINIGSLALNVATTIPLTTSYRTNVGFISSFISRYQLNDKPVEAPIATASHNTKSITDTNSLLGVSSGNLDTLNDLLALPSARSRVVIVSNSADKTLFTNAVTIQESQGYQWDEVYVYVKDLDMPIDPFEKNKFLYTAMSRAKNFLYVENHGVVNSEPNSVVSSDTETAGKEIEQAKQMFDDNIKYANQVTDVLNGASFISPQALTVGESTVTDLETNSDPNIISVPSYADLTPDESLEAGAVLRDTLDNPVEHLSYPTNRSLRRRDLDTSTMYVVPVSGKTDRINYAVLMKTMSGKYTIVGYLGDQDFKNNPNIITNPSAQTIDFNALKGFRDFPIPNIDLFLAGKYEVGSVGTFGNTFDKFRTRDINKTISTFLESYYGETASGLFLIPAKGELKYSIRIFKAKDAKDIQKEFGDFIPKYGVPYLVISNLKVEGSPEQGEGRSHLIPMQPNDFTTSSEYYAPIRSLYDNVQIVEEALGIYLGSEEFGDLIRQYADQNYSISGKKVQLNKTVKPLSEMIDTQVDQDTERSVQRIVELIYGLNRHVYTFKTEQEAIDYMKTGTPTGDANGHYILDGNRAVGVEENKDGKFVILVSKDPADPMADTQYYKKEFMHEGAGPAATALNNLAKANLRTNDQQLRQTIYTKLDKNGKPTPDSKKMTRAASILTNYDDDGKPKTYTDFDAMYADPRTQMLLKGKTYQKVGDLARALMEGSKSAEAIAAYPELEGHPMSYSMAQDFISIFSSGPITFEYLNNIVGDEMYTDGNHTPKVGYPLREPLNMEEVNEKGSKLTENLDYFNRKLYTTFAGVQKTSVQYILSEAKGKDKPGPIEEDQVFNAAEKFRTIPAVGELARIADLVRNAIKEDQKIHFQPQGVLTVVDGNIVRNKNVMGVMIDSDGITSLFTPVPIEGANPVVLWHEGLHLITQEAINKGRKDRMAKRDTPEARLYQRVASLKKRFDAAVKLKVNPATGNKYTLQEVYQETISKSDIHEFVASLSNDTFRKLATEISVMPKSKKGILRAFLEALLDFLGLSSDANIYEATLATLENFYKVSNTETGKVEEVLDIPIKPVVMDLAKSELSYIETINKKIKEIDDEFEFEDLISTLEQNPYITNLPRFGDLDSKDNQVADVKLSPEYNKLTDNEKANILNKASFAYFDLNKEYVHGQLGSIYTTKSINYTIDRLFKESDAFKNDKSKMLLNLAKSILTKEITDSNLALKNTLVETAESSPVLAFQILFNEVFSNKDKAEFRVRTFSANNTEAVEKLAASEEGKLILDAIIALRDIDSAALADIAEGRASFRYSIAEEFLLTMLQRNMDLDQSGSTTVILSRNEAIFNIRDMLKDPKTVYPSGRTLSQTNAKINALYKEMNENPDRAHVILTYELPPLEDELAAYQSLNSVNNKTGRLMFMDLIKDIYPKTSFDDATVLDIDLELAALGEEEFYSKDRLDKEIENSSGIIEYLKVYNKNYENTLSESMKDYLSFIRVNDKYLSASLAYIKTMQLASSLDWTQGMSHVLTQLSEIGNTTISNVDRAILEHLANTISKALVANYLDGVNLNPNVGIVPINSLTGAVSYVAYYKEGLTTIPTYEELKLMKDVKLSKETYKTSDLNEFFLQNNPISIAEFNRHFTRAEAINTVRGIVNVMASMKDTDLFISTRSMNNGNSIKMIKAKASDVSYTIKEHFEMQIFDLYVAGKLKTLKNRFMQSKVGDKTVNLILSTGSAAERLSAIRNFYGLFNMPSDNITIPTSMIAEITEKVKGFLSKIDELSEYNEVIKDEDSSNTNNFEDWIEDIDGYISTLNQVIASSDDFIRNPSVADLNNNKFYKFHESSWMYDTVNNLLEVDSTLFTGSKGKSKLRKVPQHLLTDFYKHNIFVRKSHEGVTVGNTIEAVGEFAGAKNTDNNSVTPYLRENEYFFFQRKFVSGFMDGIRQSNGKSYFQYSYIPSDSPKHPIFKIGILADSDIKLSLSRAIDQIQEKMNLVNIDVLHYEKSIKGDLFRNFGVLGEAIKEVGGTVTEENKAEIIEAAMRIMSKQAKEYLTRVIADTKPSFDSSFFSSVLRLAAKSDEHKSYFSPQYESTIKKIQEELVQDNKAVNFTSKNKEDIDLILPIFDLFYKNNMINSYFLNQLYMGDPMFYKDPADVVKRFAGVKAPGLKGVVDPVIGMREYYKMGILGDTKVAKQSTEEVFKQLFFGSTKVPNEEKAQFEDFMEFFGKDFEPTDAQGFMTPMRLAELSRGFEKSWELGKVHKPVYFDVQAHSFTKEDGSVYTTGKPTYIKNSTIVLSDDLVTRFPLLNKLRESMYENQLDELVFQSAVKEGGPVAEYPNFQDVLNGTAKIPSIMLSNHNYRLQFNASSDPNKKVSIFTQLQYFLNVYGDKLSNNTYEDSQAAARQVYTLVAELFKMGSDELFSEVDKSLKMFLKRSLKGAGSERALDLLNNGTDINHPLLEKKAITAIASALEKASVKVKFSGGKLVLQSAEGISFYPNMKDLMTQANELKYRTETVMGRKMMVAEVIMPRELLTSEQLAMLDEGKSPYMLPDGFAFRIPSTELHSAVAFRVVGTYSDSKSNVIIVPKEIVPIHGSDHDVDSLFVITRELIDKEVSFINADVLNTNLTTIGNLYNYIHEMEKSYSNQPELIVELQDLKREMNTILKISSDLDIEEANHEEVEQKYIADSTRRYQDRTNWGKKNGYVFVNGKWVIASSSAVKLAKLLEKLSDIVASKPTLKPMAERMLDLMSYINESVSYVDIAEKGVPVGHKMERGRYVFNKDYFSFINTNLEKLERMAESIQEELQPAFLPDIERGIANLKSLKKKYIKNYVIETMLDVITDESNKYRMTTPIAFTPVENAVERAHLKDRLPNTKYDLSKMSEEYGAYSALTAGVVLTGAFANAAKSFGYLTRAGGDALVNKLYELISTTKNATDNAQLLEVYMYVKSMNEKNATEYFEKTKPIFSDVQKYLEAALKAGLRKYLTETYDTKSYHSPKLSLDSRFELAIDGTVHNFDKLSTIDIRNQFTVTQVYDALTNAAIDNLKLGLLPKARINTNTGSVVVGLVAVGVPIDVIIDLLYQDVFTDLITGKVNRVDKWLSENLSKVAGVKERTLSSSELIDNINNPKEEVTAQALRLFAKGYKIGEDMRNLSSFLSIIQEVPVFVEDIFDTVPNMTNYIGTVLTDAKGETLLRSRSDFSFIVSNMFDSAPHIRAALDLNVKLADLIEESFLIHNPMISKFARTINTQLLDDTKAEESNAKIRRAFGKYILSTSPEVLDRLSEVSPKVLKLKDTKLILSGQRVFNDEVSARLLKIKEYNQKHSSLMGVNYFLHNCSVSANENGTKTIRFRSSLGLTAKDMGKIILGFRQLNAFGFNDAGEVVMSNVPIGYISDFQSDLKIYALLNLGLENMSSSFAAYMPSGMFENTLEYYTNELSRLIKNPNDLAKLSPHFELHYSLQNATSLPYVSWAFEKKYSDDSHAGVEDVEVVHEDKSVTKHRVYFDKRYSKVDKNGEVLKYSPKYIKESYKKDTRVFIKVFETPNDIYYQQVGKIKDVYTNIMSFSYKTSDYFDSRIPSLAASFMEGKSFTTYSKLAKVIKANDIIHVYPSDNFDRTNRILARVKSVSSKDKMYSVTIEKIELSDVANTMSTTVTELKKLSSEDLLEKLNCYG